MFDLFPHFTTLDLKDKDRYESFMSQYPPMSDLSFATLMVWWNFDHDIRVSSLNDNLVIAYKLPGDELNSGLSLVGTHKIDESVQTLFRHMLQGKQTPRLVHVPEFVVNSMGNADMLHTVEERDYAEYVVPVSRLYPFDEIRSDERTKLRKFLHGVEGQNIETKVLDLNVEQNQKLLLSCANSWWQEHGFISDPRGDEVQALLTSITQANVLGIKNICLFIDGQLCGFSLYQVSHNKEYLIGNHLKTRWGVSRIFDYMAYLTAGEAYKLGIPFLNIEMDLGIEGLRAHKMDLKPVKFLKKYTITPEVSQPEMLNILNPLMQKMADITI